MGKEFLLVLALALPACGGPSPLVLPQITEAARAGCLSGDTWHGCTAKLVNMSTEAGVRNLAAFQKAAFAVCSPNASMEKCEFDVASATGTPLEAPRSPAASGASFAKPYGD